VDGSQGEVTESKGTQSAQNTTDPTQVAGTDQDDGPKHEKRDSKYIHMEHSSHSIDRPGRMLHTKRESLAEN
jgi:hypothetical protein